MDMPHPVVRDARDGRPVRPRFSLFVPLYVALAVVAGGLWFVAGRGPSFVAELGAFGPLMLVGGVASVLTAAALHFRHPEAWSTHRPIVVAVALQAVSGVLQPLAAILVAYGWFAASLGNPGAIHAALGLGVATSLIGILSNAFFWIGVRQARRRPGPPALRPAALAIWFVAAAVLLNHAASLSPFVESATIVSTISAAAGVIDTLLLALLGISLLAGARSGERPKRAWWLAAAAVLVVLVGMAIHPFIALLLGPITPGAGVYVQLPQAISLVGALAMLGAFALAFPTDPAKAAT